MARINGASNYLNYFNNLINNQITQNKSNSSVSSTKTDTQKADPGVTTEELSPELSSALSSLAGLLNSSNAQNPLANSQVSASVSKLLQSGADVQKLNSVMASISGESDDLLYTRTGADDADITDTNKVAVFGADMQNFLRQATDIAKRGEDINGYLDSTAKILEKGDYDDLRRFISVTNTVLATNQPLKEFFKFSNDILDKRHYDFESNIFSVQTMLGYGTRLDTAVNIMKNMETTNLEGRNNLVDLNRTIIDAKNKGLYLPYLFNKMSEAGDSRGFMDAYMKANNLKTTAPDFNKFKRIERIDGEDMVIRQGESAALFAQAISSQDGLLPESVLHWSSVQTGAISQGSSYLDLSKLAPGVYDMYVKIGPGYGGTDTAKKRVVVLPKDEITDPLIINAEGKLKITVEKGSAGLDSDLFMKMNGKDAQLITQKAQTNTGFTLETDYKDGDMFDFFIKTHGDSWGIGTYDHGTNTALSSDGRAYYKKEQLSENSWRIKFEDLPENRADWDYDDVVIKVELIPNKKKAAPAVATPSYEAPKVVENKANEVEKKDLSSVINSVMQNKAEPVKLQPIRSAPNSLQKAAYTQYTQSYNQITNNETDVERMERLVSLLKPKMKDEDVYNFLDEKVGKENIVKFLDLINQPSLGKKYQKRNAEGFDVFLAMGKDSQFFQKSCDELRRCVDKQDVENFFNKKQLSNQESNEALKMIGYTQTISISERFEFKTTNNQVSNINDLPEKK